MDRELLGRLRRLREAHATLAVELSAARRELREARNEIAGLRAQLAYERQQQVGLRPVRMRIGSRAW